VVVDGEFSGDFCVNAEFTPAHFEPFFPVPEKLMSYHYVRSGRLIVEVDGLAPVVLKPGDIAILPRNDPHRLESQVGLPPADASAISRVTADGVHRVTTGTNGPKAEVWCGFLATATNGEHPLLDALPPLLTLNVAGGEAEWLESSMRFLAEGQPSPEVVARLAELFVKQAVREYVERLPAGASGWLRGLTDPAVSKALSIIHQRYAEDLDVEGLAKESGVSRTVLGERFGELLGEPPMRYCARWRMRVAANMLRDGKQNTANVAYSVGFNSEAAFNRAFKREYGMPPATWRRQIEEEADAVTLAPAPGAEPLQPPPKDEIRSCTAADGTKLAYAVAGEGFPLVKAASWMSHLEVDPVSPAHGHWVSECARRNLFIRSDMRGFGLSEWEPPTLDFEHMVEDLATVIDAAGVETCDLLGLSHGGAIAMAYAARHPERVRKLVTVNGFAAGWRVRADPEEIGWRESLLEMNRRRPAYRRSQLGEMFITLYYPSASQEIIDWHNDNFRKLGPANNMEPVIDLVSRIDIRDEMAKIRAPTLMFHCRLDGNVPLAAGRQAADAITGARFVELESANHFVLADEPAWPIIVREMRAFLAD
jgi:pimeloyl-ACP methyl ester carboxylesterase/AraC-like DNA-binding protein